MKFFSAISWLALASSTVAYTISDVQVSLTKNGQRVQANSAEALTLESQTDKLEVDFKLKGSGQPHQLVLLMTAGNGLDYAFYPKFTLNTIKAKIPVAKIPDGLKFQDKISVSIVAADANSKVQKKVADLVPSEKLQSSLPVKKVTRLGAKPEIHHQFKQEVDTVGVFFPVVFSGLAVALMVILLVSWAVALKDEVFGAKEGSIWKVGYLATLTMFEFTFAKYYLGATIFSLLFQGAVLACPLLFFGSRSLSTLARVRR